MFNIRLLRNFIEASCNCAMKNRFWNNVRSKGWQTAWRILEMEPGFSDVWIGQIDDLITDAVLEDIDNKCV